MDSMKKDTQVIEILKIKQRFTPLLLSPLFMGPLFSEGIVLDFDIKLILCKLILYKRISDSKNDEVPYFDKSVQMSYDCSFYNIINKINTSDICDLLIKNLSILEEKNIFLKNVFLLFDVTKKMNNQMLKQIIHR